MEKSLEKGGFSMSYPYSRKFPLCEVEKLIHKKKARCAQLKNRPKTL